VSNCRFCSSDAVRFAFARKGRSFERCARCRAYTRPDADGFDTNEYESGEYAARIEESIGTEAALAKFDEFASLLRPGNLLEVGSGTGHILAAAQLRGFTVTGVGASEFHRTYIRRTWAIETIAEPLETGSLKSASFDSVISVNVLEHIADPYAHLTAIARVLKPEGRCLISTANADCAVAGVCGRYWAMFKPPGHVSIPSPKSLRLVGERVGLRVLRTWCSEYPLETPVGIAVALRDWLEERKHGQIANRSSREGARAARQKWQRLMKRRQFRFVAALFSQLMIAASVKVLYEKPAIAGGV